MLISYNTAKLAKANGYPQGNTMWHYLENGDRYYGNSEYVSNNKKDWYSAIEQSELQQWLRTKQIDITVICDWTKEGRKYNVGVSYVNSNNEVDIWIERTPATLTTYDCIKGYNIYEEALEAGLEYALLTL